MGQNNKKRSPITCLCNGIRQDTIAQAIIEGVENIDEIYDKTTAGVGPCGGSCRPYIKNMLDQYNENGTFPEVARPIKKKK